MKVVYIIQNDIPSDEANAIQKVKMCDAFSTIGHDVTLIAPGKNKNEFENTLASEYELRGDFNVKVTLFPKIPKIGVLLYAFLSIISAKALNPDIVYTRSPIIGFFSVLGGLKTVYEAHQPPNFGTVVKTMHNYLMRSSNLISLVTISPPLKQEFLNRYPNIYRKIVVAHDGADPIVNNHDAESTQMIDLVSNDKALQVGYTGHLYQGKGMEIISEIVNKCGFAFFHIIGGTSEDVQMWEEKLGHYENIEFYGHHRHPHVIKTLTEFDVVLAPYQHDVRGSGGKSDLSRWMSPLKIFEYMAAGRAILCSDLPVLKDVLTHEENVYFIDPNRPDAWVDALKDLCNDQSEVERLGENAKIKFESNYTWEKRAEKITNKIRI